MPPPHHHHHHHHHTHTHTHHHHARTHRLQVGSVVHAYDGSPASETRLTYDEQVTAMTLWCATGVPLIIGGKLPLAANANGTRTLALLTNAEILAVHNESDARASFTPESPTPSSPLYGWRSTPSSHATFTYVSMYNTGTKAEELSVSLAVVGAGGTVCVRDLWSHAVISASVTGTLSATVPAHGARAFLLTPVGAAECTTGLYATHRN